MNKREATARLKINKLLEKAGWHLIDEDGKRANVEVETKTDLGDDFEHTAKGFIDYLLLDDNQKPIAVLEAKRESIPPLSAKEQARDYANSIHVRYILLSNGNTHFLWDMQSGNPEPISSFPTQESLMGKIKLPPADPQALVGEPVDENYIALSQLPDFIQNPAYTNGGDERINYIKSNKLKILRKYQVNAIKSIQQATASGKTRYLLEMATGTGKTLTCAALIKLFLKTGNAHRVLFLVDRIELEDQAEKAFKNSIGSDFTIKVYKRAKDNWGDAEVVITTVQSLQTNDRYRDKFSPTDFDLIISDEAHRSISGNARAVFEYFIGYRIGLTATPKDYLKNTGSDENTEKEFERRQLLDTYTTFGCESGQPTFRYSLTDGVNDPDGPYLVNPYIIDARTEITTKLLSEEGYAVHKVVDEDVEITGIFGARHFEKTFFNEKTNEILASAFLDHAKKDPISGEIGKSIIFAVSQAHAAKIVNILNKLAMDRWPGKYQSDFAIQITSNVKNAQDYTIQFGENNNLLGHTKWLENYESSRARIAVTVAMMTTGYDCSDLLNVVFMRPVFSPSDFIQMKGRGTRLNTFCYTDYANDEELITKDKDNFYLIDFFAVCEYFEEKYNYQVPLQLPRNEQGIVIDYPPSIGGSVEDPPAIYRAVDLDETDRIDSVSKTAVGATGMVVDREMFRAFKSEAQSDEELANLYETDIDAAMEYLKTKILDKPSYFMTLDKIRKFFKLDRKIPLREALDLIMGDEAEPKPKQQLINNYFDEFMADKNLTEKLSENSHLYDLAHQLFDAYISIQKVQEYIDAKEFGKLEDTNQISISDYEALDKEGIAKPLLEYIRDYINIDSLRG